jgi:hypothetical protein
LKKTLGHALLTLDELTTLLVEVEAVVNDRPITYLTSDENDPEPLTPSHFLCGHRITTLPLSNTTLEELQDPDFGVKDRELRTRAKRLDQILLQCWRRWKTEYLPALRESHRFGSRRYGETENRIKVGDIVLVHSDLGRRVNWPLAIVTELKVGNDGLVRSASIQTKHGLSNRPIAKLYPLEVCATLDGERPSQSGPNLDPPSSQAGATLDPPTRTSRAAALRGRDRVQRWTKQLLK